MNDTARTAPLQRIQPSSGWVPLRLREIWEYRELVFFLTWRDITVRYKQTALGISWAIIQPVFTMVVLSVVFGKLAKIPSDGYPYPLFSLAALVPWTLFVNGLTQASNSLVGAQNLVKRVYFPRMVMPMSSVLAGLVDFLIAFVILLLLMGYYVFIAGVPGIVPTANVLWLPLFVTLALTTSLGVSLWLSALNVEYRDVRYVVPFLTQLWMYATPIVYPASIVPEPWKTLIGLNPMAGVVEGFRWALLGSPIAPGPIVWASGVVSLLLLAGGAYYFRRMERNFADVV